MPDLVETGRELPVNRCRADTIIMVNHSTAARAKDCECYFPPFCRHSFLRSFKRHSLNFSAWCPSAVSIVCLLLVIFGAL